MGLLVSTIIAASILGILGIGALIGAIIKKCRNERYYNMV